MCIFQGGKLKMFGRLPVVIFTTFQKQTPNRKQLRVTNSCAHFVENIKCPRLNYSPNHWQIGDVNVTIMQVAFDANLIKASRMLHGQFACHRDCSEVKDYNKLAFGLPHHGVTQ